MLTSVVIMDVKHDLHEWKENVMLSTWKGENVEEGVWTKGCEELELTRNEWII
jgi:hypothetical protein